MQTRINRTRFPCDITPSLLMSHFEAYWKVAKDGRDFVPVLSTDDIAGVDV
jgi:hypothetical protein